MSSQILRIKEVQMVTGLSRASIYNRISKESRYYDAAFPHPIKLGDRAIGFISGEVEEWIDFRVNERSL